MTRKKDNLASFGFAFPAGSPHVSRTMMLAELTLLLDYVQDPAASRADYIQAIVEDNCLNKRTERNRLISKRYLLELYALDHELLLFRALLFYWRRDPAGRPLLALLCAYARDSLLRASSRYILPLPAGAAVTRESTEEFLDSLAPGRYSPGKLASNAKNINSTWTQSGHLRGRTNKKRSHPTTTSGPLAYALLLAYLTGVRGSSLFHGEYVKLLDCSFDRAVALAQEASQRGWLVCKRVGDVIEVLFPNLINEQEMGWLREQG
ncbi:hypothetical protein [Desulfurivibrio alkaliphilus]|uniref:DUF1819 family protein n=1 Tax=Desulfurivibrio alkaliphilus (strain DSM 19089 / UNIQEM U267 / AHT2) TaxID=589865 RepID=D6Z671_DESAT|nr:hypothetical protein [Desulfurivibrio alkaliphilus]ADH86836.1 conserved hypothetical protein [Desulfurivibrio alkaliphilus AHT 2]